MNSLVNNECTENGQQTDEDRTVVAPDALPYFQDMESEHLKERVSELEVENGRLCEQLIAYVPAVSALNDCITSLEMQTLAHEKPHDHEESKVLTYHFSILLLHYYSFCICDSFGS